MNKYWMYVMLTCIFEMLWVFGFSTAESIWQWVLVICVILIDFYFLSKACEGLPTGTVYAIFAAFGSIGTVLMDYFLFAGTINLLKLLFIGVLVTGVIGLKIADNHQEEGVKA
ncbi:DMT family transporter [Sutcliffiella halmapala]|uniref:DMT family transporter n=1 Tax=Sutcliffiella halmapala TaxID=79882 RepID=UPI000995431A|nr:SMR family transporter [Sutcliffiella halmapala]